MSKDQKNNLARLSFYSQDSDDLLNAALGRELHEKLRDELSGSSFRELRDGVCALFWRGRDLGRDHGYGNGLKVRHDELYEKVRAEVVADIVHRLDRNNDD